MIIEPFAIGPHRFVDAQDLTEAEQTAVSEALRDGLQTIPGGDRCEARGLDSAGNYPIIRFGVFKAKKLVGAWWIGCNRKTTRSTAQNIVIDSVPLAGWTPGNEDFFQPVNLVTLGKWMLENKFARRDGGSVQVASFSITYDATRKPEGPILQDVRDEVAKRTDVEIVAATKNGRSEATFKPKAIEPTPVRIRSSR